MYTPPAYAETDAAFLRGCMRAWSFATLVTQGEAGLNATHLPFLVDDPLPGEAGCGTLVTHMARANPQFRDLQAGVPALAIFQGPHAFISPSWYRQRLTFPTWNYTAVHAHGRPRTVETAGEILAVLRRTVATYDTPLGGEWDFGAMPEALVQSRLGAIAAVRLPVVRLEGKMKLNQDKSIDDRCGVVAALERRGEPQGLAVAALIRAQPGMADRTLEKGDIA